MPKLVTLFGVVAVTGPALADPPFINMVFPPPGIVAPRENPSFPHEQPAYPEHATQRQEDGTAKGAPTAVRVAMTIPLQPEKHGPNFAADCTRAGTEAAAEALLRSAGKSETRN